MEHCDNEKVCIFVQQCYKCILPFCEAIRHMDATGAVCVLSPLPGPSECHLDWCL